MYFTPPEKKGSVYEGNKTEEALLKFATELAVIAHPEERGRRYKKELEAIEAMSVSEIKVRPRGRCLLAGGPACRSQPLVWSERRSWRSRVSLWLPSPTPDLPAPLGAFHWPCPSS